MSKIINEATKKYAEFARLYRERPVTFFRQVLQIEPSEQQIPLIIAGTRSNARVACKSATGTGKTCVAAGVTLHQLFCEPDVKILGTAPSSGQLKRGLKAEITKLHRRMPTALQDLVELKAEEVILKDKAEQFAALVSANTENQESLAGLHAGKVLIINDEASAVADNSYDTLQGNLTTDGSAMIQISNPVRADGKFRGLWSNPDMAKIWKLVTLDAFGSPFISQKWIDNMALEYGEDSDFYRMRVLGEFPRVSEDLFFDHDNIVAAIDAQVRYHQFDKICGVDVARFGSDMTVFCLRQGPKILDIKTFQGLRTNEVCGELVAYNNMHQASLYCIDGIGVGAGVVDQAIDLGLPVADVVVNEKSNDPRTYFNVRAQLYGACRKWLDNGGSIPNDRELIKQLESIRYGYNNRMQIQLISKIDMKKRYKLPSPDIVDALVLSFYEAYRQFEAPNTSQVKARPIAKRNHKLI